MKNNKWFGLLIAVGLLSQGACVAVTRVPVGMIFTDAAVNQGVTQNKLGAKTGKACAKSILGLIAWGDASASAAAKAGGVTSITAVDDNFYSILGIYQELCTHVSGD